MTPNVWIWEIHCPIISTAIFVSLDNVGVTIKNVKFEPNFQRNSKFLDFAKFYLSQDRGGQKSEIQAKFSTRLKFFDFTKFHRSQDQGCTKSKIQPNFQPGSNFLKLSKKKKKKKKDNPDCLVIIDLYLFYLVCQKYLNV